MSRMRRKNKKRKPSKFRNIELNTQPANSNTNSDTGSIITIDNVESYFLNRSIAIPNIHNIVLQMKENKDSSESSEVEMDDPNVTPTEQQQPSTSEFQVVETSNDEISSEKNETKNETSRTARRRRQRKKKRAQEVFIVEDSLNENSDESPGENPDENSRENQDENLTDSPEDIKTNKKTRKNARRRQKPKEPEVDVGEQSQATNVSENVPTITQNKKILPPRFNTLAFRNVPVGELIRKYIAKEREMHFQKPDYDKCDYYAYDYETVEECAEELGPNETIEVTIDCREFIPMFAEYIPIRHYFENTRVVRLVQRPLLDSEIPPLPFPVEIFPDIVSSEVDSEETKNDDNETIINETEESEQGTNKDDEIWFSWMDLFTAEDIKTELTSDENIAADDDEAFEKSTVKLGNSSIKSEKETIVKENLEKRIWNSDCFKSMRQRIRQVEKDIKVMENNMVEVKETMDELKRVHNISPKKQAPKENIKSVESQTETVNQETQTQQRSRNQEKVIFCDKNTVMQMSVNSSECSKSDNVTNPLCDEAINTKPFAACPKGVLKPRVRRLRKQSDILKLSLPDLDSVEAAIIAKTKSLKMQIKLNEDKAKREMKAQALLDNFFDNSALQQTSETKVETPIDQKADTPTATKVETLTNKEFKTPTGKKVKTRTGKKVETSTGKEVDASAKKVETPTGKKVGKSTGKKVDASSAKKVETPTSKKVEKSTGKKVERSTGKKVETSTGKQVEASCSKTVDSSIGKIFKTQTRKKIETSTAKIVEFKFNVDGDTLIASNKNEAEVNECVKEILKQLKDRVNTNSEGIVITEQPQSESLEQIKEMKTIQEINTILAKRSELLKKKFELERHKFSNDPDKIDYRDVIAAQKADIEDKLTSHEFCTCTVVKSNPSAPHLCVEGHRLCFRKNEKVSNAEVALSAAEWSYLLKLGIKQDEIFYKEMLAKNTIEDSVIFLKHVEDELIANGITVSSIPALRIESDREYEVDDNDPDIRRAEIIRLYTTKRE